MVQSYRGKRVGIKLLWIYTMRAHYLLEGHCILEVIVFDFPRPPDSRLPADFSQISADFQTLISCIQCDYHTHSYQPNFLQCICMPYPVTVAHDLMWYFACSQQRWRQTTSRAGERLLTSIDGRWMDEAQPDSCPLLSEL